MSIFAHVDLEEDAVVPCRVGLMGVGELDQARWRACEEVRSRGNHATVGAIESIHLDMPLSGGPHTSAG